MFPRSFAIAIAAALAFAPFASRAATEIAGQQACTRKEFPTKQPQTLPVILRRLLPTEVTVEERMNNGQQSNASGFLVDSTGYVVTNTHVLPPSPGRTIQVILNNGETYPAKLVGEDSIKDLAVLKIDPQRALPFVTWGDSNCIASGDSVIVIGNPFGDFDTVTKGIISDPHRYKVAVGGYVSDFIQFDAPINRGSSGGPIFDSAGNLIGITSELESPNGGWVGIGYAIRSNVARRVIEELKRSGTVSHGFAGVTYDGLNLNLAKALRINDPTKPFGALITKVLPGSPAARAGLSPGDVVVAVDGKEVKESRGLGIEFITHPAGTTFDLLVQRDGRESHFSITTTEEELNAPKTQVHLRRFNSGIKFKMKGGSVIISSIGANSAAGKYVLEGDVVLSIDGRPVKTVEDASTAMKRKPLHGGNYLVRGLRTGSPFFAAFPAGN